MIAPPRHRVPSVCVVAPLPPPYGGMSLQAEKLASHLASEGLSVDVIVTNPTPPRLLGWMRQLPMVRTLLRELQYFAMLLRDLPRCDVVHHFSASGLYFFAQSAPLLILSGLLRKRIILNYRGGDAPKFLRRWRRCIVPLVHLADCIAVPSEFLQQLFREYGLEATLLPNIADTALFNWQERQQFAPRLLVTRHLDPMYNVECLLRAFRIVKARFPEARFTVAGDGSDASRLRVLVRSWNLTDVNFSGAVTHRDLPALYAAHDIYVNSSNVDNFPGALVEAACCGLPIVTTRAGGIPNMIRHRRNGVLVDLNDHESLAAGVIEIIEDAGFGRALAREARLWAERFSWRNVFPELLKCYGLSSRADTNTCAQRVMLT